MKGLKFINASILAILISIGFVACSGDNDSDDTKKVLIENFSQGNLTFTEQSNEQSFSFTANSSWTVTVSSSGGDTSWCTVYPSSGEKGTQTVRVSTTANTSYDDRNATITLTSGTQTKSFVVTQKQKDALLLTSDKFEIDKAGGTITVEVKSNVSYTATIGNECKDWIKEGSGTRGLTTTTKVYTITTNEDLDKREGTITFTDGTLSETVHVYQTGGYSVILNKRSYVIDENGGSITVELRSNCDYDVIMPDVDWIKEDKTRSMSSHTLYYNILANTTYDSRETKIIYKDKNDQARDTLTITQAQLNAVILVNKSVSVERSGGTVEAKVKSNVSYDVVMPDVDWISRVPKTRGLTESVERFTVAQNSVEDSRSAEIIFKSKDGKRDTLKVTQAGNIVEVNVKTLGTFSKLYGSLGKPLKFKVVGPVYESELNSDLNESCTYCDLSDAYIYNSKDLVYESMPSCLAKYKKLDKIIVPNNMTEIGQYAFKGYPLTTIVLPNALTTIKGGAFWSSALTNIVIPNSVKTIYTAAFRECSNLSSIVLPEGMDKIYSNCFYETNLKSIVIPSTVTTIETVAFYYCSNLESVTFPEKLVKIGEMAFEHCHKLSTISLPDSLKEIGKNAFASCISLTNVTLPKGLISIENYAFEYSGYKTISIPSSVTKIGIKAFVGSKFTTCYIYAKTPPTCTISGDNMSFQVGSFVDSKLYVPKGCLEAYKDWSSMFYNIYEMEE